MSRWSGYTLVGNDDSELSSEEKPRYRRRSRYTTVYQIATVVIVYLCGILSCLYLQKMKISGERKTQWLGNDVSTYETFLHYNKTFARPQSPEVAKAWRSIFPSGRGFIQDLKISPEVSGVAVFHQLHCLNAIRLSLYGSREQQHTAKPLSSNVSNHVHDFHHIRHCIDYLRQSLMCHADTNLEPVNHTLGGVTGWNSRKQCRNYAEVVEMATRLRTYDKTDIQ